MMIIDRFESEYAIIEDNENRLEIKRTLLPENAKEGDVIVVKNKAFSVDEEETEKRRKEILKKLKKL
ncbi:MAG: DUF3006 domain-containing protein [Oscillospiraceae bacterium]|nr:DUF3006 domain-containing protein [Oscillospiraceae bacterium]